MAKLIIPFVPHRRGPEPQTLRVEKLVNAAWKFAHCALWPEQEFSREEHEATKIYIREYFNAATDNKRAFKALIQRVILARNYVQGGKDRFLPEPSVWFNRRYPFGFAGTLAWLQKVEKQRLEVPGYLAHIEAMAHGFYRYSVLPTELRLNRCREQLLHYRADNLLQLFYSTLVHTHYVRA